jgi:hypothetical protein
MNIYRVIYHSNKQCVGRVIILCLEGGPYLTCSSQAHQVINGNLEQTQDIEYGTNFCDSAIDIFTEEEIFV